MSIVTKSCLMLALAYFVLGDVVSIELHRARQEPFNIRAEALALRRRFALPRGFNAHDDFIPLSDYQNVQVRVLRYLCINDSSFMEKSHWAPRHKDSKSFSTQEAPMFGCLVLSADLVSTQNTIRRPRRRTKRTEPCLKSLMDLDLSLDFFRKTSLLWETLRLIIRFLLKQPTLQEWPLCLESSMEFLEWDGRRFQ